MSLMGIKPPTYMDGKAFAGKFEDNPRTYIFGSADRFDESIDMQRSVLDGRYVYIKNFMPQLPLIYRNKYREQIPMNKQLIELNTKGVLEGDAAYIFMQNKPFEELYDLSKAPHELNNLAEDKAHTKLKVRLKRQLKNWMTSQGDQGQATELAAKPKSKK